MNERRMIILFVAILFAMLLIPTAHAQSYNYNYMGPTARSYSINGMGGSYPHYPYGGGYGYYPPRTYPQPNRPYTRSLDQYHHIEYNKPGRVGAPVVQKYYNAGPHYKNRAWNR